MHLPADGALEHLGVLDQHALRLIHQTVPGVPQRQGQPHQDPVFGLSYLTIYMSQDCLSDSKMLRCKLLEPVAIDINRRNPTCFPEHIGLLHAPQHVFAALPDLPQRVLLILVHGHGALMLTVALQQRAVLVVIEAEVPLAPHAPLPLLMLLLRRRRVTAATVAPAARTGDKLGKQRIRDPILA